MTKKKCKTRQERLRRKRGDWKKGNGKRDDDNIAPSTKNPEIIQNSEGDPDPEVNSELGGPGPKGDLKDIKVLVSEICPKGMVGDYDDDVLQALRTFHMVIEGLICDNDAGGPSAFLTTKKAEIVEVIKKLFDNETFNLAKLTVSDSVKEEEGVNLFRIEGRVERLIPVLRRAGLQVQVMKNL